jgi:hypothetical protein
MNQTHTRQELPQNNGKTAHSSDPAMPANGFPAVLYKLTVLGLVAVIVLVAGFGIGVLLSRFYTIHILLVEHSLRVLIVATIAGTLLGIIFHLRRTGHND